MDFVFSKMTAADAEAIVRWRYPAPYQIYDIADAVPLLDPALDYYVTRSAGRVAAFLCYGGDARVQGFEYDESCLDPGWGLRPDLTGRGYGAHFVAQVLDFVRRRAKGRALRATVLASNARCLKVCASVGLTESHRFSRPADGTAFIVLTGSQRGRPGRPSG